MSEPSKNPSPMRLYRDEIRGGLERVRDRYPNGRSARKATAILLDMDIWTDFLAEHGGDAGALFFVCAQVAEGVTLKEVCAHYVLSYGLVWSWLIEQPERLERYYAAQRGVADAFVAEVVPLVDQVAPGGEGGGRGGGGGSSSPDVPHRRLQAEMRLKVAGRYDRNRFGEKEIAGGGVVAPVLNFIMAGGVVTIAPPAGGVLPSALTLENGDEGREGIEADSDRTGWPAGEPEPAHAGGEGRDAGAGNEGGESARGERGYGAREGADVPETADR